MEDEDNDSQAYTSAEFHNAVQKQLIGTAIATLSEIKLAWAQVAPFLDAGRAICRDDVRLNGQLAMHAQEYAADHLVEAEEAYLSLSVRDREDGLEWLSQSWWLSDVILSDDNPDRVRAALAAMERSAAKVREWLAEQEAARAVPHPPVETDQPE